MGSMSPRPTIEDCHDSRKHGSGDHGVAFARQMDKVDGVIAQRDLLVVHDYFNRASAQPAFHFRNVGSTLLLGAEETQIVSARLQDCESVPFGTSLSMRRSIIAVVSKWHSGISDLSVDTLGPEQGLQLRGICTLVANVPAMGVAGTDRDNPQRRRIGGNASAHKCRDG